MENCRSRENQSSAELRARVVIAGAGAELETLTYAVPDHLAGQIEPGHRVVVPIRSRRLTGIVLEVGADLDAGGAAPKSVIEILEVHPLFDRPHLELIRFLASYYMTSIGEAYRSVIPATARVESRLLYQTGAQANPLRAATFTPLERVIVDALGKRPLSSRQLRRLGHPSEVETTLDRLLREGLIEQRDGTRGRHREARPEIVRLSRAVEGVAVRSHKHRAIIQRLTDAGPEGVRVEELTASIPNAMAALRLLESRKLVAFVASAPTTSPGGADEDASPLEPTWEQQASLAEIAPAVRERRFVTFLLWGITGSGKTEVYMRLAAEALAAQRQVLVLVPEIALADQVVRAFRNRFGNFAAILHSEQNVAERWAGWMAALNGQSRVVIGPRSAIFAPIHNLGLIVVDEEHDPAYKQEEGIRYNARDLAVVLGRLSACPVVLGSATPSAESYANARRGRYTLIRLTQRVAGRELARVELLDLREHLRPQAVSAVTQPAPDRTEAAIPLAPALIDALRQNLATGGQSIVFLNRRGYHNFLQCHLCGNVIACRNCSVSLTFHLRDRSIRCHYCGERSSAPESCPECSGLGLEGQGFGTERLATTLADLVPEARIERMDSDTSGRRGARAAIVRGLREGTVDIVVGTQMITKGFDFPRVTLVGVVLADLSLNMPDFRSAERTFQLLTQVAGRAGRSDHPGRVLIQTYAPHHYSIRAANDQDYARFIRRELDLRKELGYPPFGRMALVRIEGEDPGQVNAMATRVAAILGRDASPERLRVLGPAPAPIERIRSRYRWQVMVKAPELSAMRSALAAMRSQTAIEAERAGVRVAIDIDPVNMM